MLNNIFRSFILTIIITACSHVETPKKEEAYDVDGLKQDIKKLSEEVLLADASLVSRALIKKSIELTKEYDMTSPPRYHNLLVHMGLRDRGLCCHWVEDLLSKLDELPTSSLKYDWLVAPHWAKAGGDVYPWQLHPLSRKRTKLRCK